MKSGDLSECSNRIALLFFAIYSFIIILNIGGFFTSFYNVNLFYAIVPFSLILMVVSIYWGGGFFSSFEIGIFSFFIFAKGVSIKFFETIPIMILFIIYEHWGILL